MDIVAIVKNQVIPYTDILYTNDDARYLGEFYRDGLTEEIPAPGIQPEYGIVRKSSRGRRPVAWGMVPDGLPSRAQLYYRNLFLYAIQSWHRQKDKESDLGTCDSVKSKEYWYQKKIEDGVKCSYYDYFLRLTIWYYIANKHWPPWFQNYTTVPPQVALKPGGFAKFAFPEAQGPVDWTSDWGYFYWDGLYEAPGRPGVDNIYAFDQEGRVACGIAIIEEPPPGYYEQFWFDLFIGMDKKDWNDFPEGAGYIESQRVRAPDQFTGWVKLKAASVKGHTFNEHIFFMENTDCIGRINWTGTRTKTCSAQNLPLCNNQNLEICLGYDEDTLDWFYSQVYKLIWP
jgi:hypothetical protein